MSDVDLVKRCRLGDSEALAELFVRYQDRLFKLAYLVARSHQDAQDILQETFIRVIRAIHTYDETKGTFETWLYAIAVNLARDHLRRQKRPFLPWHLLDENKHMAGRAAQPESLSLEREWQQTIWEAVNSLEEKQRITVILRYYLDLSCAEIAKVLSCPEGTIHSRLYYARLILEQKLGEESVQLAWFMAQASFPKARGKLSGG